MNGVYTAGVFTPLNPAPLRVSMKVITSMHSIYLHVCCQCLHVSLHLIYIFITFHVFCSHSYFSAHSSVLVKVSWNNDQVGAQLLCDEAWHGGTNPELPGVVVGC